MIGKWTSLSLSDGRSFWVREVGSGKRTAVLVHGFGNSSLMWLPFVIPLLRDYRFLMPDLPGFGRSRDMRFEPGDVLGQFAQAIQKTLDHASADGRSALVGFSLGALSSLKLHSQGGFGKVEKYMHVDHSPFPQVESGWEGGIHPDLWKRFAEIVSLVEKNPASAQQSLSELSPSIREPYLDLLEKLGENSLTGEPKRWINRIMHRAPVLQSFSLNRAAWPWAYAVIECYLRGQSDFRSGLSSISVPTTLVGGSKSDLFSPKAMDFMKSSIPGSRMESFAHSGHDLIVHEPFRFARVLGEFLE